MNAIWKFTLEVAGLCKLSIPKGAQILSLQVQNGEPRIWALVDPSAPSEDRWFHTHGTGRSLVLPQEMRFVGSYQLDGGVFVGHVFERLVAP